MSDIRDRIKEIVREARHNPRRADHGMYSHEWYADRILTELTLVSDRYREALEESKAAIKKEDDDCSCGPWDHCGCDGRAVNAIKEIIDRALEEER